MSPPLPEKAWRNSRRPASEEVERLQKLQAEADPFCPLSHSSLLRTGYYTPIIPNQKGKRGLYQLFKELFETEDELGLPREGRTRETGSVC